MYKYIRDAWKNPDESYVRELMWQRAPKWKNQKAVQRIERPTRLDRARSLGYRAKKGFVVVRTRVRRGGRRKTRRFNGRKPKRMGVNKITQAKSIQRIAEERVAKKYPNMEVLNSYWVWSTGKHKYFEVILVDPQSPSIINDKKINWICSKKHTNRALRVLTSAGNKGRGIKSKGKGSEQARRRKI